MDHFVTCCKQVYSRSQCRTCLRRCSKGGFKACKYFLRKLQGWISDIGIDVSIFVPKIANFHQFMSRFVSKSWLFELILRAAWIF